MIKVGDLIKINVLNNKIHYGQFDSTKPFIEVLVIGFCPLNRQRLLIQLTGNYEKYGTLIHESILKEENLDASYLGKKFIHWDLSLVKQEELSSPEKSPSKASPKVRCQICATVRSRLKQ